MKEKKFTNINILNLNTDSEYKNLNKPKQLFDNKPKLENSLNQIKLVKNLFEITNKDKENFNLKNDTNTNKNAIIMNPYASPSKNLFNYDNKRYSNSDKIPEMKHNSEKLNEYNQLSFLNEIDIDNFIVNEVEMQEEYRSFQKNIGFLENKVNHLNHIYCNNIEERDSNTVNEIIQKHREYCKKDLYSEIDF